MYRIGLDIGSTTAKLVMVDEHNQVIFSKYERHHADIVSIVSSFLEEIIQRFGDSPVQLNITGSIGMGLSEKYEIPFVQEVVAATVLVKKVYPDISTIIDIGGEDAKIVYLRPDGSSDLRMNGNCAGGTGAFIDQMALLLGVRVEDMNDLAMQATHTYPIASRCGVFSKTDIQNLISKNVCKADIAASVFHAVAVQTIVTLSHGCEIVPKILFCGGPLTFIPALRNAFSNYLKLKPEDVVIPENANIIPAWGTALSTQESHLFIPSALLKRIRDGALSKRKLQGDSVLPAIFNNASEYSEWKKVSYSDVLKVASLKNHSGPVYLGIDSGSTTTKIVVIDEQDRLLYSHYTSNEGNPIQAVKNGLEELERKCIEAGTDLQIGGGCTTGYGEDLIRVAFQQDGGIIETIAHYMAARKINPKVSFILDIGGQDMKAIFVENGVLTRMEINEACSSGCGSFIETFAKSLNFTVEEFARIGCTAEYPCDLGTRCTVFMNSKVKQALREGFSVEDIAAGLSYSVVKNCLYKVLKLSSAEELGDEIVVQGGTMRNDSVVRAFENLTHTKVSRSSCPELMGAYGCALYAKGALRKEKAMPLRDLLSSADYTTRQLQCKGCENNCMIQKYAFGNGQTYYSGNKCEKIFSNQGSYTAKGYNVYADKYKLLFDRVPKTSESVLTIGIPRCLNMYENYPFWQALFDNCGIRTSLSEHSTFKRYESGVYSVMSDNICFPAKLVHSHIYDLINKKVDRIFFPYVIYEKPEDKKAKNTYNCPIVSGYSDVIRSAISPEIPVDSPVITFKNKNLLLKQCEEYLTELGVPDSLVKPALRKAWAAQEAYKEELHNLNRKVYSEGRAEGRLTILLAGRPYHADPLTQHKLSEMIADMGVDVITEDIVRGQEMPIDKLGIHHVSQWAYINRILRAAQWAAEQGEEVHFVQMTSFGCGPDAFLLDEVRNLLNRYGKTLTILKIDDVSNIGSIKLRVRSIIESLKFGSAVSRAEQPFVSTRVYQPEDKKKRTIIAPFFTDYLSPFLPELMKLSGYDLEVLPESDTESAEYGLKYSNNEVCYPATLIVGDIVKALKSGKYDLDSTAVVITQTGGQCRASNYIALIKHGLVEAGFETVPVVSLALGSDMTNEQHGFKLNWLKILPIAFVTILYGDCISKFYHASVPRERNVGDGKRLRTKYMEKARVYIRKNDPKGLLKLLSLAAKDFDAHILSGEEIPRVGIVGEIFLKFNSFAHKNIVNWLVDNGIEVAPPVLVNFFMQSFVNLKNRRETHVERGGLPLFLVDRIYAFVFKQIEKVNRIASEFRCFTPFPNIFKEAEHGGEVVSLAAQFGEGWLLPAEVVSFAKSGVHNVISLQPFGCIANHIISKGVEKKIKMLYPQVNLLSLDFDSGVSDVNVMNRLLLFTNNMKTLV